MNYLGTKFKDLYGKMYTNPLTGYKERLEYVERCATIMDGNTTFDLPISSPAESPRPPPGSPPCLSGQDLGTAGLCFHSPCANSA